MIGMFPNNNPIPANEETTEEDMNLFHLNEVVDGAPGRPWFFQLAIELRPGLSIKSILLGGLAGAIQILNSALPDFKLHPVDDDHLPTLTSHLVEDGFPTMTAHAFSYYKCKNRNVKMNDGPAPATPQTPKSGKKHDDDAGFNGKPMLRGTIKISASCNVKIAIENLFHDMQETGMDFQWKFHQSKESFTTIMIYGCPRLFDVEGTTAQIIFGMQEAEKKLIKKGKVSNDLTGVPLSRMNVSWRPTRKGPNRSNEDRRLSLNNIPGFAENGCWILSIETAPDDNKRLSPLINYFWKSGMCRLLLGRRTKVTITHTGASNYADRTTVQRLRRFSLRYQMMMKKYVVPKLENLNKRVEIRMKDGKQPRVKFTTLLREFMDLKVIHEGAWVPVVQACIPILRGLDAGSATVIVKSNVPAALELMKKMTKAVAAWWWGYLNEVRQYNLATCQTVMESFCTDSALLAGFSSFDPSTLEVTTEFPDEDSFLDDVEEEYGLQLIDGLEEVQPGSVQIDLGNTEEHMATLQSTLRDRDDMSIAEKTGPSRASNFTSSTGRETFRDANTAQMAMDHKDRALKNVELSRDNADLMAQLNELKLQEQKAVEDRRRKEEEQLQQMEELRQQLQQTNAIIAHGFAGNQSAVNPQAVTPGAISGNVQPASNQPPLPPLPPLPPTAQTVTFGEDTTKNIPSKTDEQPDFFSAPGMEEV